jgi:hypothetical protein
MELGYKAVPVQPQSPRGEFDLSAEPGRPGGRPILLGAAVLGPGGRGGSLAVHNHRRDHQTLVGQLGPLVYLHLRPRPRALRHLAGFEKELRQADRPCELQAR